MLTTQAASRSSRRSSAKEREGMAQEELQAAQH
jgi:hypothetical protein